MKVIKSTVPEAQKWNSNSDSSSPFLDRRLAIKSLCPPDMGTGPLALYIYLFISVRFFFLRCMYRKILARRQTLSTGADTFIAIVDVLWQDASCCCC